MALSWATRCTHGSSTSGRGAREKQWPANYLIARRRADTHRRGGRPHIHPPTHSPSPSSSRHRRRPSGARRNRSPLIWSAAASLSICWCSRGRAPVVSSGSAGGRGRAFQLYNPFIFQFGRHTPGGPFHSSIGPTRAVCQASGGGPHSRPTLASPPVRLSQIEMEISRRRPLARQSSFASRRGPPPIWPQARSRD
jgi:hypothetical protein